MSGLWIISLAYYSGVGFFLHKISALVLLAAIVAHIFRTVNLLLAVSPQSTVSGIKAFLVLFLALGTGYLISNGEAGAWAANLVIGSVLDVVIYFLEWYSIECENLTLVVNNFVIGASSFGEATVILWASVLHIAAVCTTVLMTSYHILTSHATSSGADRRSRRNSLRVPLWGGMEVSDFLAWFCIFLTAYLITPSQPFDLRLGSNLQFYGYTVKPLLRVTTEIYMTLIYLLIKIFPLLTTLLACAGLYFMLNTNFIFNSNRYALLGYCAVFAAFSVVFM